jgi:hypothetical protein
MSAQPPFDLEIGDLDAHAVKEGRWQGLSDGALRTIWFGVAFALFGGTVVAGAIGAYLSRPLVTDYCKYLIPYEIGLITAMAAYFFGKDAVARYKGH